MNILQLTDSLANGGAEKFVVELCNELEKKHKVILCSIKPIEPWMQPPKYLSPSVKLKVLNINSKYSISIIYNFYSLINNYKPDVIHVHSSYLTIYVYFISIFFSKTIFVQTIHSTLTPGYKKLFNILSRIRFLNHQFKHVCISKKIYNQYKNKYPKLRFYHIDNGIKPLKTSELVKDVEVELSQLKKSSSTRIFLAIGNYSIYKNFELLSSVFKTSEMEQQDVILCIIGEDKSVDKVHYKNVISKKGSNTHLLGFKPNVADYLASSSALILTSTHEGMPLVILEAINLGIPVIATRVGGIVDIIEDEINGFLAKSLSLNSLIESIHRFISLSDSQIAIMKQNNIRLFQKKFSISLCSNKYLRLYT